MENKSFFQSSSTVRVSNQMKLVSLLRNGPKSLTYLTKEMGLSFTAVTKIVSEVCKSGLFLMIPGDIGRKKKRGRKPFYVGLNTAAGLVCSIDLSGIRASVCLADLSNKIVIEGKSEEVRLIDRPFLASITDLIQSLLASNEAQGRPLLSICIASQGKIDKKTFDYYFVRRVVDYQHLNLSTYFRDIFHVNVFVYNDIQLGCIGEKIYGSIPTGAQNSMFSLLDEAAGCALILNGELYVGSSGFAGEMAAFNALDPYSSDTYRWQFYTASQIYMDLIKLVEQHPEHPLHGKANFTFSDIVELYQQKDPLVCSLVERSVELNALQYIAIADLLDLEAIVVYGKMLQLGESYTSGLVEAFHRYDANHRQTKILFSQLGDKASTLGAIYQATNLYFLERFGEMTQKRTNLTDYDVGRFFGNNV
jgi:N-acetylglucosamine repressor